MGGRLSQCGQALARDPLSRSYRWTKYDDSSCCHPSHAGDQVAPQDGCSSSAESQTAFSATGRHATGTPARKTEPRKAATTHPTGRRPPRSSHPLLIIVSTEIFSWPESGTIGRLQLGSGCVGFALLCQLGLFVFSRNAMGDSHLLAYAVRPKLSSIFSSPGSCGAKAGICSLA
jgi:hypothetical protein